MGTNSTITVTYHRSRPPTVVIQREPTRWKVGYVKVPELGFSTETANEQRDAFALVLLGVCNRINAKVDFDLPDVLPTEIDDIIGLLAPALKFAPGELSKEMNQLRDIGLLLYNRLSPKMKEALVTYGVRASDDEPGMDPPITVVMDSDSDEARSPICWNMVFQEEQPKPADKPSPGQPGFQFKPPQKAQLDWRRFWGFRIPISQFLFVARSPEIKVSAALAVVDDQLNFSQLERSLLSRFVAGPADLDKRLFEVACLTLRDMRIVNSREEAADWLDKLKEGSSEWLDCFLNKVAGTQDSFTEGETIPTEDQIDGWKRSWEEQALQYIFAGDWNYGLIHFAGHCYPSREESDPRNTQKRRLELSVAGRQIIIPPGYITNVLKRRASPEEWRPEDDGPFVFLNACASGKKDKVEQFPDLPAEWIEWQGAKAVIATICDVPDIFAFAFALKLYDVLFMALAASQRKALEGGAEGVSIMPDLYVAEALLKTRRYFMEHFNNPMGLAYELYAFQDAHLLPTFGEGGD